MSEPVHFWPFDQFTVKPAEETQEKDNVALPGQHVTPFEMTSGPGGNRLGREFLFETTFFDVATDDSPDPKAQPEPAVTPETIRQSLGE